MSVILADKHPASGPADFGDVRAEFAELLAGAGVFDVSHRARISLTGGDRVRWLNGMITNNVRDLPAGAGVYAFLLSPQGHILGDLYAYNHGDRITIDSDRQQLEKLLATFDHYIIMDDVEVANLSDSSASIGVAGPRSAEILKTAGIAVPELDPLHFAASTWQGKPVTVVRKDLPTVAAYEVWLAPEHFSALREALLAAGGKAVGASALGLLRIAEGIPRYGQDIRERDLPQETGQERALHFSKGCYIGQEIVERIRSRGAVHRRFAGFEVEGAQPEAGTKIQADGKDVGEVTSVASLPLPTGDRPVALGYLRREVPAGKVVQAGKAQLTVATLPLVQRPDTAIGKD